MASLISLRDALDGIIRIYRWQGGGSVGIGRSRKLHKSFLGYLLEAVGGFLTVENDPDHEAEDVAWLTLEEAGRRLAYPNERRVIATARDILIGRV